MLDVRRREFITLAAGAEAWPLAAHAQQPAMPVVGVLDAGSPRPNANTMAVFRKVLAEAGYVEGQSVMIEYRYAAGQYDRLPELAADLVRQHVKVLVATPNPNAARAAKAATATIPILFMVADDPAKLLALADEVIE
jgi:putative ABC transport system substrate-binding protein